MKETKTSGTEDLTRRTALVGMATMVVGAGAAFAFACAGKSLGGSSSVGGDAGSPLPDGGSSTDAAAVDGGDAAATGEAGTCAMTPEGEIGPYFSDDSDARFERSDITSNLDGTDTQTGVPLTLTVTIVDTEKGCAPYVGAQVDIWHCNAEGVYSDQADENTSTVTWLRGYQLTDANGRVTFKTILPGWYQGRTTHIHLRVRSSYGNASSTSDGSNTTQLFFDQSLVDTLASSVAPYSAEGENPTTNEGDHVYSGETDGANVLSLAGNATSGYAASITLGLPITSV
jgi:protocatechuate 3,4-dioxygenase beta subunit